MPFHSVFDRNIIVTPTPLPVPRFSRKGHRQASRKGCCPPEMVMNSILRGPWLRLTSENTSVGVRTSGRGNKVA